MSAFVYILYSRTLERHYVGSTELLPQDRLFLHNTKYYGQDKFTAAANDWSIILEIPCPSISIARKIEKHIKNMKSKVYIHNLQRYPEMITKLIIRYS